MTTLNAGEDAEKLDDSHVDGENERQYVCSGKQLGNFFKKKKIHNFHETPAIACLGIYPREMKTRAYTKPVHSCL